MPSCKSRVSVELVASCRVRAAWKALCLVGLYGVIPGAASSSWALLGEAAPQGSGTQESGDSGQLNTQASCATA